MRVLGIDCGIATTGWSIIDKPKLNSKFNVFGYGVITTPAGEHMPTRLKTLYDDLMEVIQEFKPDSMAIENLFFFKNQKTIITVGQARGVSILAGINSGLQVFDYTPLQVKTAVSGYGRAEKKQVQEMVKTILGLREIPKPDDAADALAIAICHLNSAL
jgi:crossover junction endodeoxyribonuclease RuvC